MRAGFEGTYRIPPRGCRPAERTARRNAFQAQYRSHQYARAEDTLDAFYRECREFLDWIGIDEIRNDLAVTQYHLGRHEDCLRTLRETIGATETGEDKLRSRLPPTDFDTYLPVARASWYNLKLCSGAAPSRPSK